MIYKNELEFLFVAKRQFEMNPDWTTFRDDDDEYIALRRHVSDIEIYKLERRVGRFTELIEEDK